MLDVKWIRDNRLALEEMLKNRRSKLDVGPVYELDAARRKILAELEDRKNKAYLPDGFYKAFIVPPSGKREMACCGEWKLAQRAVLEMIFWACRRACLPAAGRRNYPRQSA